MLAERAADAEVFLRGPSDWGDSGGIPFTGAGPVELLLGDALNGEGPLGPPALALDSPSCCILRQRELERRCLAGLHQLVAAVSAGQPEGLSIMGCKFMCHSIMTEPQSTGVETTRVGVT